MAMGSNKMKLYVIMSKYRRLHGVSLFECSFNADK